MNVDDGVNEGLPDTVNVSVKLRVPESEGVNDGVRDSVVDSETVGVSGG